MGGNVADAWADITNRGDGLFRLQIGDTDSRELRHFSGPTADRVSALALQTYDLEQAQACLEELLRLQAGRPIGAIWTEVERGLFEAAIVAYCRCFDPTGKRGYQLHRVETFEALGPEGTKAHDQIWQSKRLHYGHDVNGLRDAAVAVIVEPVGFKILVPTTRSDPKEKYVAEFAKLVSAALFFCQQQSVSLAAKLQEEVSQLGLEGALKLPKLAYQNAEKSQHAPRSSKGNKPLHSKRD